MNKIKEHLHSELISGKKPFDWFFFCVGLAMQFLAIWYGFATGTPDNLLSIISGLSGVVSVVLCAQGKISFYLFGYIQLFTYVFGAALPNHLWGEVFENVFYFITMLYGTYVWIKRYHTRSDNGSSEVMARKLNAVGWIVTVGSLVVGTIALTTILALTNDPLPFVDAISTVPAFIAQVLMCLGYREQWLYWAIIDVASIIMFIMLGNWVMTAQFIFWTLNCLYGWVMWTRNNKYSTEECV